MRIALLTTGRFTFVDLARELARLGHEPRVYSLVPPHLTRRFDLPAECNRWLGPYVAPVYAAAKVARGRVARSLTSHALLTAVDRVAAQLIEPCDIFLAMSGIGMRSLDVVRRRHGARIFLERSSRHILSQREILESIAGSDHPVADWSIDRELVGYGLADIVTVPSSQVRTSFLERGFPSDKLFLNPFGTSLDTFRPTPAPDGPPTIIMTGAWSLRKGCDVLVEAWRKLPGTRLLHVGPLGNAPVPTDPGFEHVDAVPQHELVNYYARAHVFALASREEGLALVQLQALACGLPVVCTTRTGGEDLRPWLSDPAGIQVAPPDDPSALAQALSTALTHTAPPGTPRDFLGPNRQHTSWAAYARRYESRLLQALGG